jgi:magnesium-dependent phosphatase 1
MTQILKPNDIPVSDQLSNSTELVPLLEAGPNPKLVAFDLDFTLWPFDCDKGVQPPFMPCGANIYDRWYRSASPNRDVGSIVGALLDAGIKVAYLSRNPSYYAVEQLLRLCPITSKILGKLTLWDALDSRDYFHAYSSEGVGKGKDRHFGFLKGLTHIEFEDIVFFDDIPENIIAANMQGTTSVLISNRVKGLTWDLFETGIRRWRLRGLTSPNETITSV